MEKTTLANCLAASVFVAAAGAAAAAKHGGRCHLVQVDLFRVRERLGLGLYM